METLKETLKETPMVVTIGVLLATEAPKLP